MSGRTAYDWIAMLGGALIRIAGGLLVLMIVGIIGVLLLDFSAGMRIAINRWAHGGGVDWAGFALLLGAIGTLVVSVAPFVITSSRDRRLRDIAHTTTSGGVQPTHPTQPPSAPSAPSAELSPSGGLVNEEALR